MEEMMNQQIEIAPVVERATRDYFIRGDEGAVAIVWLTCLGAKWRLRRIPGDEHFCQVIGEDGQVIGSASNLIYGDRGWAVHTKPFGGFVAADEVVFV
jgi:hypothetical protein